MYNIFYNLQTKKYLGNRFDPKPKTGEGVIQIESKSDTGLAIKNGHTITIENDLSITTTPPTPPDTSKEDKINSEKGKIDLTGVVKASDLSTKQVQDLVYLMALREDLIST